MAPGSDAMAVEDQHVHRRGVKQDGEHGRRDRGSSEFADMIGLMRT